MSSSAAALAWHQERGRLIAIAYRMLGDMGEAEDVSSEVAESALVAERRGDVIRSWPAWLTTACVRRSIDRYRALAKRRETYPGPWLPEPIATEPAPDEVASTRELLSISLLHMADQLSADARAAVVLHRAFAMTAPEIGEVLDRTPASVRQLISRAERSLHLNDESSVPRGADKPTLRRLIAAIGAGDVARVVALLDDDVTVWTDGGGKMNAARRPIRGAAAVARFYIGIFAKAERSGLHTTIDIVTVNGEPAVDSRQLLSHGTGRRDIAVAQVSSQGRVVEVRQMCNPDKLTRM